MPIAQDLDATETLGFVSELRPDWVVVDHCGLDATWHELVMDSCKKIAAIDDLGDRKLSCDIVLDQKLAASADKYQNKVLENCEKNKDIDMHLDGEVCNADFERLY